MRGAARPLVAAALSVLALVALAVGLAGAQTAPLQPVDPQAQAAQATDPAKAAPARRYSTLSDADAWRVARDVLPPAVAQPATAATSVAARAARAAKAAKAKAKGGTATTLTTPSALPAPALTGPGVKFLDDRTALIPNPSGKGRGTLVTSTQPLRARDPQGRLRGLDLRLQKSGKAWLAPVNAGADVLLGRDLDHGGLVRDVGLRVRPVATRRTAVTAREASRAFWANTDPDTDVSLTAEPGGMQATWVLRSAGAPAKLQLRLAAKGLQVASRKGGAFLVRGGSPRKAIAVVRAPLAWDRLGRTVKVTAKARNGTLTYTVAHRRKGVAYPVVVDPIVETYDWSTSTDTLGWGPRPQPMSPGHTAGSNGGSMWLDYAGGPRTSGAMNANWVARGPGTSIITAFKPGPITATFTGDTKACAFRGIVTTTNVQQDFDDGCTTTSFPADTYLAPATLASQGNAAYFQHKPTPQNATSRISMQSATLEVTDIGAPTIGATTPSWTGWVSSSHPDLHVDQIVNDEGVGVKRAALEVPNSYMLSEDVSSCTGSRTDPCRASWNAVAFQPRLGFPAYNVPEGEQQLDIAVEDLVGNTSKTSITAKVDSTGPNLSLTGMSDEEFLDGAQSLSIAATDGDPNEAEPSARRSGVASIEVRIDGERKNLWQGPACAHGCALTKTYAFDASALRTGYHELAVVATDHAGNRNAEYRDFRVDAAKPVLALSGSLYRAQGQPLTQETYALHADAHDGTFFEDGFQSGVVNIEFLFDDGTTRRTISQHPRACDDELSCKHEAELTFETKRYGPGHVIVRATDKRGNVAEEWVSVAPGDSAYQTTGLTGLEEYMTYDTFETGAGSRAHVNLTTGNLAWNVMPLVNPGRGLSTFVNVTYNSQFDRDPAHADDAYDEIGEGFSIGISGLTRVNEPLDVEHAATSRVVVLTDPDGTRHSFKREGTNRHFTPPPGVNLHLREFSPTDPLRRWAATRPDGVTYFFDADGWQTLIQDRNRNTLRFDYELVPTQSNAACPVWTPATAGYDTATCRRRLVGVTDAAGVANGRPDRTVHLAYKSATGPIASITDHGGRRVAFTYADGRLTDLTQAEGTSDERAFRFSYRAEGIRAVMDPRGSETRFDYVPNQIEKLSGDGAAPPDPFSDDRVAVARQRDGELRRYAYAESSAAGTRWRAEVADARGKTSRYRTDHRGRTKEIVDPEAARTELGWDGDNNVVRLAEAVGTTDQSVTEMGYDENGLLRWSTDGELNRHELEYTVGEGVFVAHGGEGRPDFVADLNELTTPKGTATGVPMDFTELYQVDSRGNVVSRSDGFMGGVATAEYDQYGQVTKETDEVGNVTRYEQFDPNGRAQVVVDPKGGRSEYRYDKVGNVVANSDARAETHGGLSDPRKRFQTTLGYDALDRLVTEELPKDSRASAPSFIRRTYQYDPNDNEKRSVDGNGSETTQTFDEMDRTTTIKSPPVAHVDESGPASETSRYRYDGEGLLVFEQAPRGDEDRTQEWDHSTEYEYDGNGRLVVKRQRDTGSGSWEELVTSFAYDRRGNVTGIADPKANRHHGDPAGAAGDPSRQRIAFRYDKADRRTTIVEDPDGRKLTSGIGYDRNGNVVWTTDARAGEPGADRNDFLTQLRYDYDDRLVERTDPLGRSTRYQRRADGKVTEVELPRQNTDSLSADFRERMEYDALGDVIVRHLPSMGQYSRASDVKFRYERDAVGNPTRITDGRGRTYQNTFFDSGDLKTTDRPSMWQIDAATGKATEKDWRQAANRGEQPELPSGEGAGDFGQVGGESLPDLLPKAGPVALTYDDEMRLASVTETTPKANGASSTITRDAIGRVTALRRPFDGTARTIDQRFGYDRNGNVVLSVDGANNETRMTFDQFDRLTARAAPHSGDGTPDVTRYTYDESSRVTRIDSPREDGIADRRCYDDLDRLIAEIDAVNGVTSYAHDAVGNVISTLKPKGRVDVAPDASVACDELPAKKAESDPEDDAAVGQFETVNTYDGANQLLSTQEGPSAAMRTTFAYDANGNQTLIDAPGSKSEADGPDERRRTERVYDARDQLYREIVGEGAHRRVTVSEYDGNGNLRRRVNPAGIQEQGVEPVLQDTAPDTTTQASAADRKSGTDGALQRAAQNATVYEYSNDNLLTAIHMPNGGASDRHERQSFELDDRGRVAAIAAPHEWTREPATCSDKVVDPAVDPALANKPGCIQKTTYTHFDSGWIKTSTEPATKRPDAADKVAGGDTQTYDYDARGLQTAWSSKSLSGQVRRTAERNYWPSGLLQWRRAAKPASDSSAAEPTREYDYRYSSSGQLTAVVDRGTTLGETGTHDDVTYRMAYDRADRRVATDDPKPDHDTLTTYDPNGNAATRKVNGTIADGAVADGVLAAEAAFANGSTSTFTYDELDRETETRVDRFGDQAGLQRQTFRSTWFPSGDRATRTELRGSGDVKRLEEASFYANDGRPVHQTRKQANDTDAKPPQSYTYDVNGNRTTDEQGTHQFNARDQLTKWTRNGQYGASADGKAVSYQLNGAGDVLSESDEVDGSTTTNKYAAGRLFSSNATGGPDGTVASTYDYEGSGANVTKITEQRGNAQPTDAATFAYDGFDRVKKQTSGATEKNQQTATDEDYTYDGFDRRATLSQTETVNGTKGDPKNQGLGYVGISDSLSQRGPLDAQQGGKTSSFDYDSSFESLGMTSKEGSTTELYASFGKDANGSIEGLSDEATGAYSDDARYLYDPYGNAEPTEAERQANKEPGADLGSAAKAQPFRFQGFYYDSGVKTYDMKARQYLPQAGRFLTQDRFESAAGDFNLVADPLTQNRYAFAGGNPISRVEFDGHSFLDDVKEKAEDGADAVKEGAEDVADQGKEAYEGGKDAVKETVEMAKNPKQTAKALGHAVTHPKETVENVAKSCDGRSVANCAGYAAVSAVGGKGATAAARGAAKGGAKAGAKGAAKGSDGGGGGRGGASSSSSSASRSSYDSSKARAGAGGGNSTGQTGRKATQGPCSNGNSFTGETPVLMSDGTTKPIRLVGVGDRVMTTDAATGTPSARWVVDLIRGTGAKALVDVTIDGKVTTATDGHPFWSISRGTWVLAKHLRVGELLRGADGERALVERVTPHTETTTVFNLTVEGTHTYYAGAELVLVHNAEKCGGSNSTPSGKDLENARRRGVSRAWSDEKELVARGDSGTREWSRGERKELSERGRVSGYQGHHGRSVKDFPDEADVGDNVHFVKGAAEHIAEHRGNYKNKTTRAHSDRSKRLKRLRREQDG